jgi:L-2-hydroxyglutarate oxidase LhgO
VNSQFDIDAVVIGAGVVGLACAAALARCGYEVLVVESASQIGTGTSSRNSEVIHAGLYYPTGSLKQRLCVAGRRMLYTYLAQRNISHKKCEKLIVATSLQEDSGLTSLADRAKSNDVENVNHISGYEARLLEPNLRATSALWSRETGILNSHGLMCALQGQLEDLGGIIVFNTPFLAGESLETGGLSCSFGGNEPINLSCKILVNSAGLNAQSVARRLAGYDAYTYCPEQYLVKGSYFSCVTRPAFSRLIYPTPVDGGLGVHVTLDMAGQMRFGPDVEWLSHNDPSLVDYKVDPKRASDFYAAVRRYWPSLPDDAIQADYAGCRSKLSPQNAPAADFVIQGPEVHDIDGLVNLFGIESPGLTSSLAIAETVVARVKRLCDPF